MLNGSLYTPSFVLCTLASICRIWLLYYDIHLSKLQLQRVWLKVIDPNIIKQNWFAKNQKTFGNANYLIKYALIMTILYSIWNVSVRIISTTSNNNNTLAKILDLIDTIIVLCAAIIFGGLIFKLRSFYYDTLGIKRELYISLESAVIIIIFNTIIYIWYEIEHLINGKIAMQCYRYMILVSCTSFICMLTLLPKRLLSQNNYNYNCYRCFSLSILLFCFKCTCCTCLQNCWCCKAVIIIITVKRESITNVLVVKV